ncbi:hypothetical protein BROUX41_000457 [Berkeleyomyces rouxiae]
MIPLSLRTAAQWTGSWPLVSLASMPVALLAAPGRAIVECGKLWPLVRLVVYAATLNNRMSNGVPQYKQTFKRSRQVSWLLPLHVAHGVLQLVMFELRRMGLVAPGTVSLAEAVACMFWGWGGLLLVKPLRRGHPPTSRPSYQFIAVARPALELWSWYTKDPRPYLASMAFLDTFMWVRVQLKLCIVFGITNSSLAYALALPLSAVISLWVWGFKFAILSPGIGVPFFMLVNWLVSRFARQRFGQHSKLSMGQRPWSFGDVLLWGLLRLGFADLEVLRLLAHQNSPEYTGSVMDDYGYVPKTLVSGVPITTNNRYFSTQTSLDPK